MENTELNVGDVVEAIKEIQVYNPETFEPEPLAPIGSRGTVVLKRKFKEKGYFYGVQLDGVATRVVVSDPLSLIPWTSSFKRA